MNALSKNISHSGWDTYYQTQNGERAWGGEPDGFLSKHFDEVLPKSGKVIDVASGDGRNTELFLGKGLNVVATDLSATALNSFKNRCIRNNSEVPLLISGDFNAMDLCEQQFECAVSFNSLPHFEDMWFSMNKIISLLSPGGIAVFNAFTPNDVAYGLGEKLSQNVYHYKDTLFTFTTEDEVSSKMPSNTKILHSETKQWEEPDHGGYRTGTHIHEACYFIVEKT